MAERADNERRFNIARQTADFARLCRQQQAGELFRSDLGRRRKRSARTVVLGGPGAPVDTRRYDSQPGAAEPIGAFPTQAGDRVRASWTAGTAGHLEVHTDGLAGDGGRRGTWTIASRGRRRGSSSRRERASSSDRANTDERQSSGRRPTPTMEEQRLQLGSPAPDSWQLDPDAIRNSRAARQATGRATANNSRFTLANIQPLIPSAEAIPDHNVLISPHDAQRRSSEPEIDELVSSQSSRPMVPPAPAPTPLTVTLAQVALPTPPHTVEPGHAPLARSKSPAQPPKKSLSGLDFSVIAEDLLAQLASRDKALGFLPDASSNRTISRPKDRRRRPRGPEPRRPLGELPITVLSQPDPEQAARLSQTRLEEAQKEAEDAARKRNERPIERMPSKIGLPQLRPHPDHAAGQLTLGRERLPSSEPSVRDLHMRNQRKTEAVFAKGTAM